MYEEYDMSPYNFSNLYLKALKELDFMESLGDGTTFKIPNKDIYLYISDDGCSWYNLGCNGLKPTGMSFEEVLEEVCANVKSKLLFHLDIFSQIDKYDSYIKPYTCSKFFGTGIKVESNEV